jgi:hypothetical protein
MLCSQQLLPVGIWERIRQNLIDRTEDRHVGADPECQAVEAQERAVVGLSGNNESQTLADSMELWQKRTFPASRRNFLHRFNPPVAHQRC